MSCGVGHGRGSDPVLLWPAAAAPIRSLAWEPPYAMGAALKGQKKKKKRERKREKIYKYQMLKRVWRKGSLPTSLVGT